jgi:oligo-1,6-glucosidase
MTKSSQWWKRSIVYQIYPRSFLDSNGDGVGDINGIMQKMEYLHELGIDVIWLCPIYKSPNADNGYDISGYCEIMKEFGTMQDFDSMLQSAHSYGIKVVMDLVVNHTSDEHPWFIESRKSLNNPYRDFYIWKNGKNGKAPNNWESYFGGSAWQYDPKTDQYYLHLFSPKQPDLNWENENMRNQIYDMMTWWCEKGIDGFRMDVINMISKDQGFPDGNVMASGYASPIPYVNDGPRVHEFLREMNQKVLSRYNLMTVGEMPGVTIEEAIRYTNAGSNELNMVFQFEHVDLGNGLLGKWSCAKASPTELKMIFSKWQEGLERTGWNSLYWSNHDQPRAVSRFGNDTEAYREVSAKMLATCLHMMKGTPFIYQGEELGMINAGFGCIDEYRDIESINAYYELTGKGLIKPDEMMECLKARSRDNARTPMQWNDSDNAGFTTGTAWIKVNPNYHIINAESQINDPDSVFNYYKRLIQLRKKYDIIVYGSYEMMSERNENLYIYKRKYEGEELLVACNFSDKEQPFNMTTYGFGWPCEMLISNYHSERKGFLRPYEAKVVYKTLEISDKSVSL